MQVGLRIVIGLFLALLIARTLGQAIIWQHSVPDASNGLVARDSASNLYFATRTSYLGGSRLKVQKFLPNGALVWETVRTFTVGPTWTTDTELTLRSIAVSPNRVIVLFHARRDGGNGAFVRSFMYGLDLLTGVYSLSGADWDSEWEVLSISGNVAARAGRVVATGDAIVDFVAADTFAFLGTVNYYTVSSVNDLIIDSDGTAYLAATNNNETVKIGKCVASGSLSVQNINVPGYPEETLSRVSVDASASRVYALGTALRQTSMPYDREVVLYRLDTNTGFYLGASTLGSVGDEFAGDLTIVPGQGVIASGYGYPFGSTYIRRFGTDGFAVWSQELPGYAIGASPTRHAVDPDGNTLVLDQYYVDNSNSPMRVNRVNAATGAILGKLDVGNFNPRQLLTDAAGNFYINADGFNVESVLMRAQPARLEFGDNNVIGGITYPSGRIDLPAPAGTDQVWTLTSASPSVVSVPSSVTVPSGTPRAYFHYSVSPVASITTVAINARHGGFIMQRALTVIPARLAHVSVFPNVVIGGVPTTGTVHTSGNAPQGGLTIALSTSKPTVASVPTSVTVPGGSYGIDFQITTYGVNANQGVVLSAVEGSITKTAFFAVNAPALTSIEVAPSSLKGGTSGTLKLNISGIAPTGGFSIVLISGAPGVVFLSASASIPAGQVTHSINVPTAAVTSSLNVTIFATRSGIYKTATLTVTP